MKIIALLSLLGMLSHCPIFASIGDTTKTKESLTQIKFRLTPQLYQKSFQERNQGANLLRRRNVFSGEIGIDVQQKIYKNWSISVGAGISTVPVKYSFDFQADIAYPNFPVANERIDLIDSYYGNAYWSIPIALQTKIRLKKNNFILFEVGLQRVGLLSSDYVSIGGMTYSNVQKEEADVFEMRLEDNSLNRFTTYFAKVGIGRQGKRTNTIQASLVVNYSSARIGKGTYVFSNLSVQSSGRISMGMNYIGLELAYGLTILKKRTKKP